jgi:hypothetical protein
MTEPTYRSFSTIKVVAIVVAIITGGYMLPWMIAVLRDVRHWSVFWVNLLLGWTVVGWIVALVMSLTGQRTEEYVVVQSSDIAIEGIIVNPQDSQK